MNHQLEALGRSELVEGIKSEIERAGPLTFDRFMTLALYEPGLGYYAARVDRLARSPTDYQTSPQVHSLFGDVLAGEILHVWETLGRPPALSIAEPGAGDGSLARAILAGLASRNADLAVTYHAADIRLGQEVAPLAASRAPLEQVTANRADCASPHEAPVIKRWQDLAALVWSGAKVQCVISNEFFDARPVHRMTWVDGDLRETYVDWSGNGFVDVIGPPSSAARAAWLATGRSTPSEGWRGEISSRLATELAGVASLVDRGVVLTIDYGYGDQPGESETTPDTLVAYYRHQWNDEIYRRIGEQDLTSNVDFRAFLAIGKSLGLHPAGSLSQRDFLLERSFAAEAERWISLESTPGRRWQSRFDLTELIASDGLGKLRVVAQTKDLDCYRLTDAILASTRAVTIP